VFYYTDSRHVLTEKKMHRLQYEEGHNEFKTYFRRFSRRRANIAQCEKEIQHLFHRCPMFTICYIVVKQCFLPNRLFKVSNSIIYAMNYRNNTKGQWLTYCILISKQKQKICL
jgi:hypothetical protein